jgi:hypothetical protein
MWVLGAVLFLHLVLVSDGALQGTHFSGLGNIVLHCSVACVLFVHWETRISLADCVDALMHGGNPSLDENLPRMTEVTNLIAIYFFLKITIGAVATTISHRLSVNNP